MYKCSICKKMSNNNEPVNKVVTKKRPRNYHYYIIKFKNPHGKTKTIITETEPDKKDKNIQILKQFDSKGWEIVEEIVCCKDCAKNNGENNE